MHNIRDVTRRNLQGESSSYNSGGFHNETAPIPILARDPLSPTGSSPRTGRSRYNNNINSGDRIPLTPITHYLLNRLISVAPVRLRRELRIRKGSIAVAILVLLLTLSFFFFDYVYDLILVYNARPSSAASADVWGVEEFDAPTGARAVLVQHHGAMDRLNVTLPQECAFQSMFCKTIRLSPQLLPSWTLHIVSPQCTDCTDTANYKPAVRGVTLTTEHAVYATSSDPLGRIGPMLFAMASVTDDIPLALALSQWSWMRRVYLAFNTKWDDAGATATGTSPTPYLAVMGVPSTDQPGRVALRRAQRATWMTYQEVARSENDFTGALLPLYLFAAVEPTQPAPPSATTTTTAPGAEEDGEGEGVAAEQTTVRPAPTTDPYTYVNASSVAPTVQEFEQATQARAAVADNEESVHYTHRRVSLRDGWEDAELSQSPCGAIATHTVDENTAMSALTTLTTTLGLPVTPAFVAGAQYICHASAELWRESLAHRNVMWIDMMTDRRPTTNKVFGGTGKWGLAVEVGMTQKLILWLEYAYHAFPHVPYIIKGDDDSYLKVPQFLHDLRHVVADAMLLPNGTDVRSYMSVPIMGSAPATKLTTANRNRPGQEADANRHVAHVGIDDTPCLYWGSLRIHKSIRFAAGMTFMVHRHMAHAILSPSLRRRGVDVVKLATHTYHRRNYLAYRRSVFHREDMLLGLLLNASMPQAQQFCAQGKVFHVREGYPRFHDVHVGKTHSITWSTVVAHRCRPADYHYLHYFFRNENLFSKAELPQRGMLEANALQHVWDWVMEQREALPAEVVNWDDLPQVKWTHNERRAPSYDISEEDQVAVYHAVLHRMQHLPSRMFYGYYMEPLT